MMWKLRWYNGFMKYALAAPRNFDRMKHIDRLCLPLSRKLSNKDLVIIDLSNVGFIKPMGVISVLLLVESIAKMDAPERPDLNLIAPAHPGVLDYLLKIELIAALKSLCEWKIPSRIKVGEGKLKPVIPIKRFCNWEEIDDIAVAMQNTFHTKLRGLATLLQPCDVVFSELAINVVEHANSNGGFVLAQQYDYRDGSKLEIAVGDCGIGILGSLNQNKKIRGQFNSDRQAITRVLQGGFSRHNNRYRGYGLHNMKEELIGAPDRSLTLRSGTGYAIIHAGRRPYSSQCAYFPGTLGHAVIPCG
jgi:hypothetical protein